MRPVPSEDLLDVIGCEIDERPTGAPGIDELAPFVRSVERVAGAVTVAFAPDARESLLAFVEAERQCCAGIGWSVQETPGLALRIEAGEPALDVINALFNQRHIDSSQ